MMAGVFFVGFLPILPLWSMLGVARYLKIEVFIDIFEMTFIFAGLLNKFF
jgi:hypothetical protein